MFRVVQQRTHHLAAVQQVQDRSGGAHRALGLVARFLEHAGQCGLPVTELPRQLRAVHPAGAAHGQDPEEARPARLLEVVAEPRQDRDDEEEDPRAELVRRLQEYERFKKAAEDITKAEDKEVFVKDLEEEPWFGVK